MRYVRYEEKYISDRSRRKSVGAGIFHALRRSSEEVRQRWNVIVADKDTFAWGLYVADQAVLLPSANSSNYLDALLKVIEKYKIDAVIPGSESEVNVLSHVGNKLPIPVICNRSELMPLMMNKFLLVEKLREMGLPYIETFPISEWEQAIKKYDFPFIIKPTRQTGGSKGLHVVFTKGEIQILLSALQLPSTQAQYGYCIQPYIGSQDEEYTVGVLSDKNGNLIDSIVMHRKLNGLSLYNAEVHNGITYAISSGYSQGFFIKHPQIQSYCENLAKTLGSQGPLNVQLRIHEGNIYVFELHPRFSGSSTMRADVGFNEADILLRNTLYNEQFCRLNYRHDVAAIRAFEHVIVPIDQLIKPEKVTRKSKVRSQKSEAYRI